MSDVFLKLVNLSIAASWLILAVILVRFLLKKAPKWISCVLWALVAFRLVCPFSLESALSLIPSSETINTSHYTARPYIQSGIDIIDNTANSYLGSHYFEGVTVAPNDSPLNPINVISTIWIIGIAVMLLYALISYIRLKKSVGVSIPVKDNIFACDEVKSPFILGIIKPLIYVPSSMEGETLDYVITHEMTHIKRRDHWWKPFGFLLLAVYWFNPLCWLAYILLCRDIEMACDEKVIRDLDNDRKAAYSQALLDCSFPRRSIAACPLAFGEVGVKERVKSVLNYKKPAFWIIAVAVVACIITAVCFLTNPMSLSGKLGVSMDMAVAEQNRSSHTEGNFIAADYDILRIKKGKDKTTVYAWVYYAEYSFDGSDVKTKSSSHIPTAVTFDTSADGSDSSTYDVIEYWIPRDGSYYAGDIREKFPMLLWGKAFDVSGAGLQKEKCLQAARDYYGAGKQSNIKSSVTKWFDCLHGDEMIWDGRLEISLNVFPGVTFRAYSGIIEAVTDKETVTLYNGMPIWSVYFCDLTGDGLPELCSSLSFGSGMVDNRVMIYDYANGVSYSLEDRGVTDYILRQNESDGQLYVDKKSYMGGGLLSTGRLVFEDDCLQVLWPEKPNDNILEIIDPTKDPNFSYDTAVEKFYEDDYNEYFFGGIYSKYVIVQYADGSEEDITAALCSGRASISDLDRFDIRYWAEPKKSSLDDAISKAILEHYASDKPDGLIHVESHVILGKDAVSGTTRLGSDKSEDYITYYIYMHHEKYSSYGGELKTVGGSAGPIAITFRRGQEGENVLEEYWEPRNGSGYAKDIRDKFPAEAAELALSQAYSKELKYQNMNKAFYILNNSNSIDVKIAELLDTICSSPSFSSSTHDYIREHESEYNELIGYGKFTLQYCFSEFLKGGQTDLRGHTMAIVCNDISTAWGEALAIDGTAPATGQGWFDEFRNNAETLAKQYSRENLEKYYPASFLLLQMSDSNFEIKEWYLY